MALNKVMLIGNVGADPEVRYLEQNNPQNPAKVATFRLATTERYRDRNNELRENTEWHNIVAWRQSADVCERFVRKGTQLYIEGRLRTRSYTDNTGAKRYTTEINVDTLQLLGRRDDQGAPQGGFQGGQPSYQQAAPAAQRSAAQPSYQQSYQAPSAPAASAFQAPQAPAAAPIDLGVDDGGDDLPF